MRTLFVLAALAAAPVAHAHEESKCSRFMDQQRAVMERAEKANTAVFALSEAAVSAADNPEEVDAAIRGPHADAVESVTGVFEAAGDMDATLAGCPSVSGRR